MRRRRRISWKPRASGSPNCARLSSAQADRRLQTTLGRLDAQLVASIDDIKLGRVADAYFALDADFEAYDSAEGRKEHSVDLIAELGGLRKTARAVIGRYPQGAEILAEAAGLDLAETPGALEQAEAGAKQLEEIAARASDLTEPDVPDALAEPKEAIEQSRNRFERAKHVALKLFTADNFANAAAGLRKLALETWDQVVKRVPKAAAIGAASAAAGIPTALLALWLGQHGVELLLETAGAIGGINAALGKKGGAFAETLDLLKYWAHRKPAEPEPPKSSRPKAPRRGRRKETGDDAGVS